ncbi:MAG: TIGR00282 family metallophosphoesterase [Gemmatimonadota bacterium]
MKILFVGDIFGRPGRRALQAGLTAARRELAPDFVIVNGENAAGGFGITSSIVDEILAEGVGVITSGNHVWDKREVYERLDREPRLLRPDNYPDGNPGRGVWAGRIGAVDGAVVNLQGRVFMKNIECPFRRLDLVLDSEAVGSARIVIVDFHAEATAEKIALGRYADGRVTAVIGTHTHVPSADTRILPGGTAYVTDVGMTGPHGGVIGVRAEGAIERFLKQTPNRFQVAGEDVRFQAILLTVEEETGRATSIERIDEPIG